MSYHFGDKEGLYIEVLKHYRAKAHEEYPPDLGMDDTSSPEQRIGAFIRSLTFRLLKPGSSSCFWQIFAREFIEPTAAFDTMVEETIRPSYNLLMGLLRELAGPGVAETALMRCAASIVGQCLYYRNSRQVISRLVGRGSFAVKEIEEISDHITLFSLSALRSFHGGSHAKRKASDSRDNASEDIIKSDQEGFMEKNGTGAQAQQERFYVYVVFGGWSRS